ncbi:dihydrofolate reductase family protein [Sciscionella marina]|uniref:dihydrofolate reductase family protein n=1 Tax=Sciscionella marina TaxID=508770 RepID=UPI00036DF8C3|nr:dihydrofolate reductase family protein [Sciscionella marina]
MGRIISHFFISLDGVVESPDKWHFRYFNEEMGAAMDRSIASTEAMLMGRLLYDEWSVHWPEDPSGDPFGEFINRIPKYVVSNSITEPAWRNTTALAVDVAEIEKLKVWTPGAIGISGSATLVRWLLANGLLDELNLMVHPIAVGEGQRLFDAVGIHPMRLLRQETFSTGVLNLHYAPTDVPRP